ncbi:uncharacterized protein BKCO1_37000139 [Diplodia corticola]|uniref:Zn(2)-C6 fungal-type domain-containing protein n=1 Tax=Diplodia corticola TaxID=236234 RepID=A0A1J9QVV1_9PEZI|nr:uncharacterized protein BKCO1_37000139 [Diplodia corticola]OJD32505.1 hypothetical protein BKCO1_37000139 [Diplodia corticola]
MSLTKTCQNCFRAKIRCDRTQSNEACDRCHRLRKQCLFRPSTRRYNSQMRDSRIEALEAQVRELLGSGRTSPSAGNSMSPEPQAAPSDPDHDAVDQGLLSMQQADVCINVFKTRMTPHFPFVVLPAHVSAAQLRHEKPFLFLAVLAAASFDEMPVQRQLGRLLKQAVSERILAAGGLTFEVLQGLLVYLAWSHYHNRPRLYSQYLQLAVSIVIDLRLDREPVAAWKTYAGSHRNPLNGPASSSRSADEQRAAAGCFYLSSTIANLLQKLNTIPYTDYMANCCLSLAGLAETPTDKYLYPMVRLQHIMESIDFMSVQQQQQAVVEDEAATKAAVYAVRTELSALRASLPFELNECTSLLMQFHTAELFLCQAALLDWNLLALPSAASSGTPSSSAGSALHLEVLCAGLSAAKSLLDAYLALPARAETAFNNSEWIQLSFGLTVAARLAVASTTAGSITGPNAVITDQQKQAVSTMSQLRAALSISNALRAIAQRVGALASATNSQTDAGQQAEAGASGNVFAQYEQRVRRIQQWFDVLSAPARREQLQQLNRTRSSSNVSHYRSRSRSRSHSPPQQQPPSHHHQSHPSSSSSSGSSYLQPSHGHAAAADSLPMSLDFAPTAADPHHGQQQHHHHHLGAMSFPPPSAEQTAAGTTSQSQSLLPDFPLDFLLGHGNGNGNGAGAGQGCGDNNGDWLYANVANGGTDWLI